MNWIKCSDSLPEIDTPVLAGYFGYKGKFFLGCYARTISDYETNEWCWSLCEDFGEGDWTEDDYYSITHWMPLPQPPEDF
ncbi:DUF551 domain-containing protein [Photorhabdus akhurstii]|uniref:DUF551 domain-containing protein n=1 Tax=Photorhabdus akhurstii TaxID=171438 RepID=UPI0037038DE5